MATSRTTLRLADRPGGFTLIELLVVMSVMAVLFVVIIAAAFRIDPGAVAATKATLRQLEGIATQYESITGGIVYHDGDLGARKWSQPQPIDDPADLRDVPNGDPIPQYPIPIPGYGIVPERLRAITIERFVRTVIDVPDLRKQLFSMSDDVLKDDEFVDANHPSYPSYIFPQGGDGFLEVVDGWGTPIRYFHESGPDVPLAENFRPISRPFFVSAGPDGYWGEYGTNVDDDGDGKPDADDNIYSTDLE